MGLSSYFFQGKLEKAVRHCKYAHEIEPSLPGPLNSLIAIYCYSGKISAAIPLVEKQKCINPLSYQRYYFEGFIYFFDGKYEAALAPLRRCIEIVPKGVGNWLYAWTLANNNKYKEAISVIDNSLNEDSNNTDYMLPLMLKFSLLNKKEKALKIIASDLHKAIKIGAPVLPYLASSILAFLGEKEKAIDLLNYAVDRGFLNYPLIAKKDPFLENIRGEKRFKKLMEKVKHEWENFEV